MQEPKIVNGVNVDNLFGTINAIKEKPVIAKFNFCVQNKWIDGGLNRTTIKDFYGACQTQPHKQTFVLDADEPPVLLSEDNGPNPVEYALTALAACVTTALVYHAAARGIKIDEVESKLEGDLDVRGLLGIDEKVRNGYESVKITFKIKADVPQEQLEDVVKLGPTYSPVFDIFTNKVPVTVQLEKSEALAQRKAA